MSDYTRGLPPIRMPEIPSPPNFAESTAKRLIENAHRFRRGCEKDREAAVFYACDSAGTIDVSSISHLGSQMILFLGFDAEGRHTEMIQHYTQVSFRMVAVAKDEVAEDRPRIGFNSRYLGADDSEPTEI